MTNEEQRRLHKLVDIVVATARSERMTPDSLMKATMRVLGAAAREKIEVIEKEIVGRKQRRIKRVPRK